VKAVFQSLKERHTFVFFIVMFVILTIALDPSRTIDTKVLAKHDKLKHIAAFFTLSYFFFESSIRLKNSVKFFILFFFMCTIEYLQQVIGRGPISFGDIIAGISGVLLYLLFKYTIKNLFYKP